MIEAHRLRDTGGLYKLTHPHTGCIPKGESRKGFTFITTTHADLALVPKNYTL